MKLIRSKLGFSDLISPSTIIGDGGAGRGEGDGDEAVAESSFFSMISPSKSASGN